MWVELGGQVLQDCGNFICVDSIYILEWVVKKWWKFYIKDGVDIVIVCVLDNLFIKVVCCFVKYYYYIVFCYLLCVEL